MKLKTKMTILFLVIILVPMCFATIAFFGIGYHEKVDMIHEMQKEGKMIGTIVNKQFIRSIVLAMMVILIATSTLITAWINKDIYKPIKELSKAMQHIAGGDYDFRLPDTGEGDIGLLYSNYEQMRLKLKENAEEELANEKKSKELISNISHDLKTPITSIKGYVEGIMDGVADTPEKMDKYIKTIYNKANDMDRLINELTTYSAIDSNKIQYHFHVINISDYFADCVEEVGLELDSQNIKLNYTNLVSDDTCIVADPEQLKKVINNVISNSVKYMDNADGTIDMRIIEENESVKIEIEDNGKGIASKDIGNIFERFYRTDASRNSLKGGSGIGLSIVKKIIEDHGGYVWATSHEGEGTCIHFVIRKYVEHTDEVVI